jgi:hypothetical protein
VLVCRDFEQPALVEAVVHRVRNSSAARKIVCIPAVMGPEWYPGNHVREFLGAYVEISDNLRKSDQTDRASFIHTPEGTSGREQANHEAITLNAA